MEFEPTILGLKGGVTPTAPVLSGSVHQQRIIFGFIFVLHRKSNQNNEMFTLLTKMKSYSKFNSDILIRLHPTRVGSGSCTQFDPELRATTEYW